jgi:ribosomal protein S18 acetylase RimI-like enzyme
MASSDSAVVIRRAEKQDVAALGELGALLVRTHFGFDPQRFLSPELASAEGYAWFLGTQLDDPEAVVFVAESAAAAMGSKPGQNSAGSGILGYVYAALEPRSWKDLRDAAGFIHDVVVTPRARGGGVGARLLEAAAEWLEVAGAPRVMLATAHRNERARQLFERLGFRPTMIEMTRERGGRGSSPR